MVTLYTQNDCRPCKMTKRALRDAGIVYEEINLDVDPAARATLKEQGWLGAPVVVPDSGEPWAGFVPDKIKGLAALATA